MASSPISPALFLRKSRFTPRLSALTFILTLLLAASISTLAQEQPVVRVSSELVKIGASVVDAHGNYVGGLQQSDFRIFVDGAESPILFFALAEEPARILVLVETSPAVYLMQNQHLTAAYSLMEGLSPQDEVALFTYSEAAHGILTFTPDKAALLQALGSIQYTLGSGQLNFYGSLAQVLDWMAAVEGKKAAVLLTTGLDSSQPSLWEVLEQRLHTTDVVIYPVALGGTFRSYAGKKKKAREKKSQPDENQETQPSDGDNPLSFAKATTALKNIAAATGGRAYFPQEPGEFVPDYREIAAGLRHQYLLGIAPLHDGKFHAITVELTRPQPVPARKSEKNTAPAFTIYARTGYLAPAQ